jgi:DNA-binding response OmpR family regulator
MARLREKLEADPNETPFFMTESGVGYRLRAETDTKL